MVLGANKGNNLTMVFDIGNRQEDYANVMNFIESLRNNSIDAIDKVKPNLARKVAIAPGKASVPRYLEMPRYDKLFDSHEHELISNNDVYKRYSELLGSYQSSGVRATKGTAANIGELNGLYCLDDHGDRCKVSVPLTMQAHFGGFKSDSKSLIDAYHSRKLYFHLRIDVTGEDYPNLQYLALFLAQFDAVLRNSQADQRFTIFLKTTRVQYFPFGISIDESVKQQINDAHMLLSRYMRLLSKKHTGLIYAIRYKSRKSGDCRVYNEVPDIAALDFKDTTSGSDFFPLIMFTREDNQYDKLFNSTIAASDLNTDKALPETGIKPEKGLFQIKEGRFRKAADDNPNVALLDYIAESSWRVLRSRWEEDVAGMDERVSTDEIEYISNRFADGESNWLTFALFSYLYRNYGKSLKGDTVVSEINNAYQMASELSFGMKQIIQNALQHSEKNVCVFSFYYDSETHDLKMSVSDLNHKNTLMKNFKNRLKYEHDNCPPELSFTVKGHQGLMGTDELYLRHCFNVFKTYDNPHNDKILEKKQINEEKSKAQWAEFRGADSSAHIGLILFYQTVLRCGASLTVQSNSDYELSAYNTFSHSFDDNHFHDTDEKALEQSAVIPGTQFLLTIPLREWSESNRAGEARISNISSFSEGYGDFAGFLDFSHQEIKSDLDELANVLDKIGNYNIQDPNGKYQIQLIWTRFWISLLEKVTNAKQVNKAWFWDVDALCYADSGDRYLASPDNCEVFVKGLFNLIGNRLESAAEVYLALTNLPKNFLEVFRDVCISLAPRKFSDRLQLYCVDKTCTGHIQLFGSTFYEATVNAMRLSIEHGSMVFRSRDCDNASRLASIVSNRAQANQKSVFPFDVVIPHSSRLNSSLFEERIVKMVDKPMTKAGANGFKLENTHMKLGSKVHIQSFYEMSFLFYRTTIANRIAFLILKSIMESTPRLLQSQNPILFYSYASYSKAILTSLVEISRAYLKGEENIAFASYQYNLQTDSENDDVQLYFGVPKDFVGGEFIQKENTLDLTAETAVVQVVPISSTLTTFDKMWSKLRQKTREDGRGVEKNEFRKLKLAANYTAFWVCDVNGIEYGGKLYPSEIEKTYWVETNLNTRAITVFTEDTKGLSELKTNPKVFFFMRASVVWDLPRNCPLCFPHESRLLSELPIVETDVTSTVPSQQIRGEHLPKSESKRKEQINRLGTYHEINNERLKLLRECVYYGHITRDKNHHQYYINTLDYFYKKEVQKGLREWLEGLRDIDVLTQSEPTLKIIFSPEHNTNVGFAQYVNTYFFDGSAEIISIDEDKVFRSNFVCEHNMLKQTITRLHEQSGAVEQDNPVEFYFVDDSINTGGTIHKANSLLHSLIPREFTGKHPNYLFKKCFFLIDRISLDSKRPYVIDNPEKNFHAYVHIDISNMRKQGDSCVGCKLQGNALKLFKRSATRRSANYWAKKYISLSPIRFDDITRMEDKRTKPLSFERMILSHIAQNFIFKDGVNTRCAGEYYDCVLFLFERVFGIRNSFSSALKPQFHFESLLNSLIGSGKRKNGMPGEDGILADRLSIAELLLKLLARPFFSFDYSFRIQIHSFLIILSECYLNEFSLPAEDIAEMIEPNDVHKSFLRDSGNTRIARTIAIAKKYFEHQSKSRYNTRSYFLQDVLFEALADMQSTYLLRKSVLRRTNALAKQLCKDEKCKYDECKYLVNNQPCKTGTRLECFWQSYVSHAQRIMDCSNDEVKAIWFEHLLLTGNEYIPSGEEIISAEIITRGEKSALLHQSEYNTDLISQRFMNELFWSNASLEFDEVSKGLRSTSTDAYYMGNFKIARRWLSQNVNIGRNTEIWYSSLDNSERQTIDERYKNFLESLRNMLVERNNLDIKDMNLAILTMRELDKGSTDSSIEDMQLVTSVFGFEPTKFFHETVKQYKAQAHYIIKSRILKAFAQGTLSQNEIGLLSSDGYHISFADFGLEDADYANEQLRREYDETHLIKGNHQKPYILLYYDNPDSLYKYEGMGRKFAPLSRVFLYISLNIPDDGNSQRRRWLPWVILRTVLAYRYSILEYLSEDFNSDVMEKHALTKHQDNILTHEKAATHTATTEDEKGILRAFNVGNASSFEELRLLLDKDIHGQGIEPRLKAELWLLLQSYVNGQIARLFNRCFHPEQSKLEEQDGVPQLYVDTVNDQPTSKSNEFKKRLITLNDMEHGQDERFLLLRSVADVEFDPETLNLKVFSMNEKYYNVEYFRCILMDIILTSIKYSTNDDSILARIDNLLESNAGDSECGTDAFELSCHVFVLSEGNDLIVLNSVKGERMHKKGADFINEEIYRRIHDPLDYGDGHMSLYTIKTFVEGIDNRLGDRNVLKGKTCFKYITSDNVRGLYGRLPIIHDNQAVLDKYSNWFETKLPIFYPEEGE